MRRWPFGVRGGLTTVPFSSDDPVVCAHQAVCLKALLAHFEGDYEAPRAFGHGVDASREVGR